MKLRRLIFAVPTALCCALSFADEAHASTNELSRTLIKQPTYKSTPQYSLIVLGSSSNVNVWMVEDGKRLFVDKNANGDLTDDGPPIEPRNVRELGARRWDFNYLLDAITPADGSRHTRFDLRRWNYGETNDSYGLSLSVNGDLPMYAGWFGTFWSAKPETAPVIHFGGPLTPKMFRAKEFTIGSGRQRLSIGFTNPGSGPGADSRLSIDALPKYVVPVANIEWPAANGGSPLRTSHLLSERCCYWEYYTSAFEMPDGVAVGEAKLSIELPAGAPPLKLTTTEIQVPVVAGSQRAESAR